MNNNHYICKLATLEEMNQKWDYEIEKAKEDKENLKVWKTRHIERFQKGMIIPYYGLLDGKIICECTASIDPSIVENRDNLINKETAYLSAFRTIEEYQGKGYFSLLFKYMLKELKKRGYNRVTIGVEPNELKNKAIYQKYGFTNFIKQAKEVYPDGTAIDVEYYYKNI